MANTSFVALTTSPTVDPVFNPTINPTLNPTFEPTVNPTVDPTLNPTFQPTLSPIYVPTLNPTVAPTSEPTIDASLYSKEAEEVETYAGYLMMGCAFGVLVLIAMCIYQRWCMKSSDTSSDYKKAEVEIRTFDERVSDWAGIRVDWTQSFLNSPPVRHDGTSFQTVLKVLENRNSELEIFKRDPGMAGAARENKMVIDLLPDRIEPWGAEIVYTSTDLPWVVLRVIDGRQFARRKIQKGWHITKVNKARVNRKSKSNLQKILEAGETCTIECEIKDYADSYKLLDLHDLLPEPDAKLKLEMANVSTIELVSTQLKSKKTSLKVAKATSSYMSWTETEDSSVFYHDGLPLAFLTPGGYVLESAVTVEDDHDNLLQSLKKGELVYVDIVSKSVYYVHITQPCIGWVSIKNDFGGLVIRKQISGITRDKSLSDFLIGNPPFPDVIDEIFTGNDVVESDLDDDGFAKMVTPASPPSTTQQGKLQSSTTQQSDTKRTVKKKDAAETPPLDTLDFLPPPPRLIPDDAATPPLIDTTSLIEQGSFVRTHSGSLAEVLMIGEDEGTSIAEVQKPGRLNATFRNLKSLRSLDNPRFNTKLGNVFE